MVQIVIKLAALLNTTENKKMSSSNLQSFYPVSSFYITEISSLFFSGTYAKSLDLETSKMFEHY